MRNLFLWKVSVGVQGEIRLKPRKFGDFQRYPPCTPTLASMYTVASPDKVSSPTMISYGSSFFHPVLC